MTLTHQAIDNQPYTGSKMSLQAWWLWLRKLKDNPIFIRERGRWGNPNPYYERLQRLSPLIVVVLLLPSLCAAFANPLLLIQDSVLVFVSMLQYCATTLVLTILNWLGIILAPALTAPAVSLEIERGSWEVLRMTPYGPEEILLAKLLGGLARLGFWPLLLGLSLVQALLFAGGLWLRGQPINGLLMGLAAFIRPGIEIFFAGSLAMYIGTWARSTTSALAIAYPSVILFKFLTVSIIRLGFIPISSRAENAYLIAVIMIPAFVYLLGTLLLLALLPGRARKLALA